MPPKTARGPKKRSIQKNKARIAKASRLTGEAEISGTFEGPGYHILRGHLMFMGPFDQSPYRNSLEAPGCGFQWKTQTPSLHTQKMFGVSKPGCLRAPPVSVFCFSWEEVEGGLGSSSRTEPTTFRLFVLHLRRVVSVGSPASAPRPSADHVGALLEHI